MSRINGWDERDYQLWSDIQSLPSYGLIAPNDRMISFNKVVKLLELHAEKRFEKDWKKSWPADPQTKGESDAD